MSDHDSNVQAHGRQGDEAPKGKVDLVAVLYILGGIPAIVAYIVLSFILARFFNFPA